MSSITLTEATVKATAYASRLKKESKRVVFEAWARQCLGRVHCADIKDQVKSLMIYDLMVSVYGKLITEAVFMGHVRDARVSRASRASRDCAKHIARQDNTNPIGYAYGSGSRAE